MKKNRRKLTPKSLFHGLARELDLLGPVYARLRVGHPALLPYATLPSLLERLTTGPRNDDNTRLVAALINLRQSTPHRLWVAILLRAFRPMLARLWKQLFGSDTQERLALLLLSFQEALCDVDPGRDPVRVAMYVRQATRRRAITALTKEHKGRDDRHDDNVDELADAWPPDVPILLRWQTAQAILRRGVLAAHVRRTHPSLSSKEQARVCQRLRRGLDRLSSEAPGSDAPANEVTL